MRGTAGKNEDGDDLSLQLEDYINRTADGDIEAMGPLYKLTKVSVYMYALSYLKNTAEAEDAMHDCYVRICESAGNYIPNGKPMRWIMTIVKNICLNRLKEIDRQTYADETEWNNLLRTEGISSNIQVAEMLGLLTDTERQIVLLYNTSGFKLREVASFLDIPLSTVFSKYKRAMKKLRKYYEGDETK